MIFSNARHFCYTQVIFVFVSIKKIKWNLKSYLPSESGVSDDFVFAVASSVVRSLLVPSSANLNINKYNIS